MAITVYQYPKCGTCRDAMKSLACKEVEVNDINVFEQPPTKAELKNLLARGVEIKKLFNTSGEVYKEMNLKDKLPGMTEDEKLDLLSTYGRLVKRPLVFDEGCKVTIGYKEDEYERVWGNRV